MHISAEVFAFNSCNCALETVQSTNQKGLNSWHHLEWEWADQYAITAVCSSHSQPVAVLSGENWSKNSYQIECNAANKHTASREPKERKNICFSSIEARNKSVKLTMPFFKIVTTTKRPANIKYIWRKTTSISYRLSAIYTFKCVSVARFGSQYFLVALQSPPKSV